MTAMRLLCLLAAALVVATGTAHAQIDIRLTPRLPVAGQPFSAEVAFERVEPTRVSVFVRTVGESAYQEVAAIRTSRSASIWEVDLPFDAPDPGIDVYIEYEVLGETLTEPLETPAETPFRAPTLHPEIRPDVTLPALRYRMISVPLVLGEVDGLSANLGPDTPLGAFGDDFGDAGDPSRWRVLRWDARAGRYLDAVRDAATFDRLAPGRGYWIITARGGTFDVERGASAGVSYDGDFPTPADVVVPVEPGWNQIGTPFLFPVRWGSVERPAGVQEPYAYRSSGFEPMQRMLLPWQGYLVFNAGPAGVLRFRAQPARDAGDPVAAVLTRLEARADAVLGVTATVGDASDAVYLSLGTPRPDLDLRKPPAIDDGLRIAVRADGADWAGRVRPRDQAVWTLDVTVPPREEVVLNLERRGPWDALAIQDLDRGVALDASGSTLVLPAFGDATTRRLQIRAADAAPAETWSVGAPWPNPTASAVQVPFALPAPTVVRGRVLDALGRTVRTLDLGELDAGSHAATWDGLDDGGQPVAAGLYLFRLDAGLRTATTLVTRL